MKSKAIAVVAFILLLILAAAIPPLVSWLAITAGSQVDRSYLFVAAAQLFLGIGWGMSFFPAFRFPLRLFLGAFIGLMSVAFLLIDALLAPQLHLMQLSLDYSIFPPVITFNLYAVLLQSVVTFLCVKVATGMMLAPAAPAAAPLQADELSFAFEPEPAEFGESDDGGERDGEQEPRYDTAEEEPAGFDFAPAGARAAPPPTAPPPPRVADLAPPAGDEEMTPREPALETAAPAGGNYGAFDFDFAAQQAPGAPAADMGEAGYAPQGFEFDAPVADDSAINAQPAVLPAATFDFDVATAPTGEGAPAPTDLGTDEFAPQSFDFAPPAATDLAAEAAAFDLGESFDAGPGLGQPAEMESFDLGDSFDMQPAAGGAADAGTAETSFDMGAWGGAETGAEATADGAFDLSSEFEMEPLPAAAAPAPPTEELSDFGFAMPEAAPAAEPAFDLGGQEPAAPGPDEFQMPDFASQGRHEAGAPEPAPAAAWDTPAEEAFPGYDLSATTEAPAEDITDFGELGDETAADFGLEYAPAAETAPAAPEEAFDLSADLAPEYAQPYSEAAAEIGTEAFPGTEEFAPEAYAEAAPVYGEEAYAEAPAEYAPEAYAEAAPEYEQPYAEPAPEYAPEAYAEAAPAEYAPEAYAEATPVYGEEAYAEPGAEYAPEAYPAGEYAPEAYAEAAPAEYASEAYAEATPEYAQPYGEAFPGTEEYAPEAYAEAAPEYAPEAYAEPAPEYAPEAYAEAPVYGEEAYAEPGAEYVPVEYAEAPSEYAAEPVEYAEPAMAYAEAELADVPAEAPQDVYAELPAEAAPAEYAPEAYAEAAPEYEQPYTEPAPEYAPEAYAEAPAEYAPEPLPEPVAGAGEGSEEGRWLGGGVEDDASQQQRLSDIRASFQELEAVNRELDHLLTGLDRAVPAVQEHQPVVPQSLDELLQVTLSSLPPIESVLTPMMAAAQASVTQAPPAVSYVEPGETGYGGDNGPIGGWQDPPPADTGGAWEAPPAEIEPTPEATAEDYAPQAGEETFDYEQAPAAELPQDEAEEAAAELPPAYAEEAATEPLPDYSQDLYAELPADLGAEPFPAPAQDGEFPTNGDAPADEFPAGDFASQGRHEASAEPVAAPEAPEFEAMPEFPETEEPPPSEEPIDTGGY